MNTPSAVQLLRNSLDRFLAKDMKGCTYATDDPNVAIAEWHASGRVVGNGNPYEMSYATFVRFRNGLIANYREYWNPVAFIAAMAGTRFDSSAE